MRESNALARQFTGRTHEASKAGRTVTSALAQAVSSAARNLDRLSRSLDLRDADTEKAVRDSRVSFEKPSEPPELARLFGDGGTLHDVRLVVADDGRLGFVLRLAWDGKPQQELFYSSEYLKNEPALRNSYFLEGLLEVFKKLEANMTAAALRCSKLEP